MDSNSIERQEQDDVMEVPEIDGCLLIELLDASLFATADDAGEQQLGFVADGDGDCWIGSQELSYDVHTRQDCEDCGLEGIVLSNLEEHGSQRPGSPAPYAVFDDDVNTLEWADTADAAMAPFTGECVGDWYMDGMVTAMGWGEEHGGTGFCFEPCYGGEAGAEQVYGSPLWG
ncbi:hypothetical protein BS78_03G280400 [Paspalum vaginatum]|nr:hypothetical protein BS78_03G280400 [Paspalum vaginatum]